jgi:hypothetical protein
MYKIRKVGILSVAKIMGLVYGLMSIVLLPFFMLFFMAASLAEPKGDAAAGAVAMLIMAVMMPFLYAAMGFVFGALGAFLYNVVAGWVGGIEMELEPPTPVTAPAQPAVV